MPWRAAASKRPWPTSEAAAGRNTRVRHTYPLHDAPEYAMIRCLARLGLAAPILLTTLACTGNPPATPTPEAMTESHSPSSTPNQDPVATETATFGAGCFWCIEAVLEQLDGVTDVVSGYTGGETDNPSYQEVCSGLTGHAEVVRVEFDPAKISYADLLDFFWRAHDPTTLNRQGADVGTQYRSAIYYHSEEQRRMAEESKQAAAANFDDPIVTEITEAPKFWEAEPGHQDYYRQNKTQGYCRVVIAPKLDKLGLDK